MAQIKIKKELAPPTEARPLLATRHITPGRGSLPSGVQIKGVFIHYDSKAAQKVLASLPPGVEVESVFISYPDAPLMVPLDDLPSLDPLYRCGLLHGAKYRRVDHHAWRFEQEGCPLDALRVLSSAHQAKVYPPLPVLKFLADKIQCYLDSDGKKSLDQCLGLGGLKKVDIVTERVRRFHVCFDFIVWKKVFHKPYKALGPVVSRQYGAVSSAARYFQKGERPEWKEARRSAELSWGLAEESWRRGKKPHFLRYFVSKYPLALLKEYPQIFGREILFHHKDVPRARSRS